MSLTRTERKGAIVVIAWLAVVALTALASLTAAAVIFILGIACVGIIAVTNQ